MRVPINIASRPADSTRPLRLCAFGLGFLALVLGAVAVRTELRARDEFRSLVDRTSQLESEIGDLEATQKEMMSWLETPQVSQIRKRSALLNSLINQKSLSWTRMFQDLEATLPAGARITGITPRTSDADGAQGRPDLKITVAATTVGPIVDFIKRMEDSPQFANPVVSDQRFPTNNEEKGEIKVSLSTLYAQLPIEVPAGAAGQSDADADAEADAEAEADEAELEDDESALEPQAGNRAVTAEETPLTASQMNAVWTGGLR